MFIMILVVARIDVYYVHRLQVACKIPTRWRPGLRASLRPGLGICSGAEGVPEEREHEKAGKLEGGGDGRRNGGGAGEARGGVGDCVRLGEDGVRAVVGEDGRASAVGPGDTEDGGAVGRDVDGAGCVVGPRMADPFVPVPVVDRQCVKLAG
jgi:hypothetical protein